MKYVYGIVWKDANVNGGLNGLNDKPVQQIEYKDIAALFSDFFKPSIPAEPMKIMSHSFIVERYFEVTSILPFRYGTILSDTVTIRKMIEKHYWVFKKNLVFVKDKVEFGLKALWNGSERESQSLKNRQSDSRDIFFRNSGPGTTYLKERYLKMLESRNNEEKTEKIIQTLDQELSKLFVAKKTKRFTTSRIFMDSVYLVDKNKSPEFQMKINGLDLESKLLLTGPWPPYNFVDELN